MAIKLRDYQVDSLKKIYNSWKSGCRAPLLVLPTGAGKTSTFVYLDSKLVESDKICWIVVHKDDLVMQTSDTLSKMGIEHGIIGAGFSECLFYKTQIVKIGTIGSKIKKKLKGQRNKAGNFDIDRYPKPDYTIVDEAHHSVAGTWAEFLAYYSKTRVLGVTATPERLDGKMLGKYSGGFYDDLIIGPTMKELVIRGFLEKQKYFTPCSIDEKSIKTKSNGDFDEKEAAKILDKPKIINNTVGWYSKISPYEPAIAFCCNVKHAEDTAKEFNDSGYKAVALVGSLTYKQKKDILEKLANGEIHVVTSCEIISEGTDVPNVSTVILMRPTWSLTLYRQQTGRGARVAIDKRPKYIIDMVGNYFRHGSPLMDTDWQIEGQKKTKKQRKEEIDNFKIKTCSNCFGSFELSDIKNNICPNCGEIFGSKQRKITIVDGELQEIVWDELEEEMKVWHERQNAEDEKRKKKEAKAKLWRSIYSCESYEELAELVSEKNYKPAWIYRTWQRVKQKKGL